MNRRDISPKRLKLKRKKERTKQDFLGGPVVKSPPAKAGDMDLIPGPHAARATKSVGHNTEPSSCNH